MLVIVSSFGAISGIILAGPRVYYAMAEDGLLFRWMGAVHPRYRTPHRAIVLQAIWSSVLVLTGTYGVIVSRVIYTEWIFFAALALGTMALRRGRGLRAGVPRLGLSGRADRSSRSSASRSSLNQIATDPREQPVRPRARCCRPAGLLRLETHSMPVIDFHNHYYPPKYMKALQSGESSVRVTDR